MLGFAPLSSTPICATEYGPVFPVGIASAEAFGNPTLQPQVLCTGIASAEAFGLPTLAAGIFPVGIVSAEAFGLTLLWQQTPAEPGWAIHAFQRIEWLVHDGNLIGQIAQRKPAPDILPTQRHLTDVSVKKNPNADFTVRYLRPDVGSVLIH